MHLRRASTAACGLRGVAEVRNRRCAAYETGAATPAKSESVPSGDRQVIQGRYGGNPDIAGRQCELFAGRADKLQLGPADRLGPEALNHTAVAEQTGRAAADDLLLNACLRVIRNRPFRNFHHDNVAEAQLTSGHGVNMRTIAAEIAVIIGRRIIDPADGRFAVQEEVFE